MGRAIPFSENELYEIERMLQSNTPIKRIAEALGRTESGVQNKISNFGGVLNFSAREAIEYRKNILMKEKTTKKTAPSNTLTPANNSILDRVDALEMQVQILTQVIKQYAKNTIDR